MWNGFNFLAISRGFSSSSSSASVVYKTRVKFFSSWSLHWALGKRAHKLSFYSHHDWRQRALKLHRIFIRKLTFELVKYKKFQIFSKQKTWKKQRKITPWERFSLEALENNSQGHNFPMKNWKSLLQIMIDFSAFFQHNGVVKFSCAVVKMNFSKCKIVDVFSKAAF